MGKRTAKTRLRTRASLTVFTIGSFRDYGPSFKTTGNRTRNRSEVKVAVTDLSVFMINWQEVPAPLQAPLQPSKPPAVSAEAVRVTTVPS